MKINLRSAGCGAFGGTKTIWGEGIYLILKIM